MSGIGASRLVTDPAAGSVIQSVAGEPVLIGLTCSNEEHKVVTFSAEIEGTGTWPTQVTPAPVVPFETGTVSVEVTPVADALEGDYPFTVRLLCDGDPVDNSARELVLRLGPPPAQEEEPVTLKAVVDAEPPSTKRTRTAKKPEPPVVPPPPEPEPEPEPVKDLEPPIATPEPEPKPKPQPKVVTFEPPPIEEEEPEPLVASDRAVSNPADGTVLSVRPGETLLVRFDVRNEQAGVRTFVLQEDRSLPSDWIHLVREQINVTPGGSGEVAFLLKPPPGADPTSYPFTVSYGELGKPLAPCYLTLTVQPTPATRIVVPQSTAKAGPFARSVGFVFNVESAGNSDTAYRVAVVAEAGEEGALKEVYETPTWLYHFDKEYDNLVSPTAGRTPPPVPHRLQVVRKGVWWLGWQERHRLKVASVPVTEPGNSGKIGNQAELTAVRWRLLPLPWFLFVPIVLMLVVLLGSGGSNLRVPNGLQGSDGTFYVLGKEPGRESLDVRLAWSAPFYALLKVEKTDQGRASVVESRAKSAQDSAEVVQYGQAQRVSYELKPRLFGNGVKADVRLVPVRSQNMLRLAIGNAPLAGAAGKDTAGEEKVEITTKDAAIVVPRNGSTSLVFKNLTGTGSVRGQTIVLWTVRPPTGFRINYFLSAPGDNQVINPGAAVTANIRVDPGALPESGDSTWEMVTTDGSNQLLRIKLQAVGQ